MLSETHIGSQFESACLVKEVGKLLDIKKTHTAAYHPQGVALVERHHRTIIAMLATMTDEYGEDWETYLAKICFMYNPLTATIATWQFPIINACSITF